MIPLLTTSIFANVPEIPINIVEIPHACNKISCILWGIPFFKRRPTPLPISTVIVLTITPLKDVKISFT
jgi:hypothetical protein